MVLEWWQEELERLAGADLPGHRRCSKCSQSKPVAEFSGAYCLPCESEYGKDKRARTGEAGRRARRDYMRRLRAEKTVSA